MRPIEAVAEDLGLSRADITPWGPGAAKLNADVVFPEKAAARRGRLVLVTAISPTPAGEGKTAPPITRASRSSMARRSGVHAACALP